MTAKDGDRAAVLTATLLAATLVAQQVAGKAVRDALFLTAFAVTAVPVVMLASAALSAAFAVLYARAMRGRPPGRALDVALGLNAGLALGGGLLSGTHPRLVAAAFYLQTALLGATLLSVFWSLVNERFDPYAAKRAMGRIAAGATLGGVLGGGLTFVLGRLMTPAAVLFALAATSLVCLAASRRLGGGASGPAEPPEDPREIATGLGVFRRTVYLRDLALLVGLGSLGEALLDFALKFEAAARYSGGEALFAFFSTYAAATSLATFLAQAVLARPALARLGLGGTVALQPGAVFLLSVLGAAEPGLLTATLARGGAASLRDSLFRSGYELLYTPLPPRFKRASKAVVDVAVDRLGVVLGSGLALLAATFLARPTAPLLAAGAALALASAALCRRLHHGYVLALGASLRSGAVQLGPDEATDGTTLAVSRSALGLDREALLAEIRALRGEPPVSAASPAASPAPEDPLLRDVAELRSGVRDRARAVLTRGGGLDAVLVGHVIPLLAARELAADALRALRPLASRATGQLVDALVDQRLEPAVRRRVARVLRGSPGPRAVDGLLLGLLDPVLSVRVECARVLGALKAQRPGLAVSESAVFEAVQRELAGPQGPGEGAPLEHLFGLLSLVLDPEPVLVSLQALRGENAALRGTALEYLDNVLPRPLRDALWPRLGVHERRPASRRARAEVESELRQSVVGMDAEALRRALLRPGPRAPRSD